MAFYDSSLRSPMPQAPENSPYGVTREQAVQRAAARLGIGTPMEPAGLNTPAGRRYFAQVVQQELARSPQAEYPTMGQLRQAGVLPSQEPTFGIMRTPTGTGPAGQPLSAARSPLLDAIVGPAVAQKPVFGPAVAQKPFGPAVAQKPIAPAIAEKPAAYGPAVAERGVHSDVRPEFQAEVDRLANTDPADLPASGPIIASGSPQQLLGGGWQPGRTIFGFSTPDVSIPQGLGMLTPSQKRQLAVPQRPKSILEQALEDQAAVAAGGEPIHSPFGTAADKNARALQSLVGGTLPGGSTVEIGPNGRAIVRGNLGPDRLRQLGVDYKYVRGDEAPGGGGFVETSRDRLKQRRAEIAARSRVRQKAKRLGLGTDIVSNDAGLNDIKQTEAGLDKALMERRNPGLADANPMEADHAGVGLVQHMARFNRQFRQAFRRNPNPHESEKEANAFLDSYKANRDFQNKLAIQEKVQAAAEKAADAARLAGMGSDMRGLFKDILSTAMTNGNGQLRSPGEIGRSLQQISPILQAIGPLAGFTPQTGLGNLGSLLTAGGNQSEATPNPVDAAQQLAVRDPSRRSRVESLGAEP